MTDKAFPNNQPEIRLIAVSGGTDLIKLGRQHGLAAQKPHSVIADGEPSSPCLTLNILNFCNITRLGVELTANIS